MKETPKAMMDSVSSEDYQNENPSNDPPPPQPQGGIFWRMGSGVVGLTTGAVKGTVGLGVGAVKWTASTSYGVVSKTAEVGVNATKTVVGKSYDVVSGSVTAVTSRLPASPISLPSIRAKGKEKDE